MNPCIPHQKKEMAPCAPATNYHLKSEVFVTLCCHSITNQELFETHLCNQSSHYENMDDFHYEGKPSHVAKSTPFAVSHYEWDTKEDTGKSMKNALYLLLYAKRYLSG